MRLFKMTVNQTKSSRFDQRFVSNFVMAEKCKPCEFYGINMLWLQMDKIWVSLYDKPESKKEVNKVEINCL